MNVEYINPFIVSTVSVFETMLGCEVSRSGLFKHDEIEGEYVISGVIGLSGKAAGSVVVRLGESTALGAAEAMLMEKKENLDDEVVDVVGELANMIAGAAKAKLEQFELSISLPNVVVGNEHEIKYSSQTTPIGIVFDCPWGLLCVEVGLVETPAVVGV